MPKAKVVGNGRSYTRNYDKVDPVLDELITELNQHDLPSRKTRAPTPSEHSRLRARLRNTLAIYVGLIAAERRELVEVAAYSQSAARRMKDELQPPGLTPSEIRSQLTRLQSAAMAWLALAEDPGRDESHFDKAREAMLTALDRTSETGQRVLWSALPQDYKHPTDGAARDAQACRPLTYHGAYNLLDEPDPIEADLERLKDWARHISKLDESVTKTVIKSGGWPSYHAGMLFEEIVPIWSAWTGRTPLLSRSSSLDQDDWAFGRWVKLVMDRLELPSIGVPRIRKLTALFHEKQ